MNDHEWQQAYNAGRLEASEGLVHLAEGLADLDSLIVKKDGPHRVKWQGEWHEGPMADAFTVLVGDIAASARTALAKYREGL